MIKGDWLVLSFVERMNPLTVPIACHPQPEPIDNTVLTRGFHLSKHLQSNCLFVDTCRKVCIVPKKTEPEERVELLHEKAGPSNKDESVSIVDETKTPS